MCLKVFEREDKRSYAMKNDTSRERSLPLVRLRIRFAWQINLVRSIDAICSQFSDFMSQLDWSIRTNESVHKPKASQIRLHISHQMAKKSSSSFLFIFTVRKSNILDKQTATMAMHCAPTYKSMAMRKTVKVLRERERGGGKDMATVSAGNHGFCRKTKSFASLFMTNGRL